MKLKASLIIPNRFFSIWTMAFLACLNASTSQATPLGLQTGGIGKGYMFSAIGELEISSHFGITNSVATGTYKSSPRERLMGKSSQKHLQNSVGYRPSPHFMLLGHMDGFWNSHSQELREQPWKLNYTASHQRLASSAVFDHGAFIFGGTIGARFYGAQQRTLTYRKITYAATTSKVILPEGIINLGFQHRNVTILSQITLPQSSDMIVDASIPQTTPTLTTTEDDNSEEATEESATESDNTPITSSYDTTKREPLEVSLNVLVDFVSAIQLAGTLSYRFLQSMEQDLHAWSAVYDEEGYRRLARLNTQRDGISASLGARYFATSDFSVSCALDYVTPSYADTKYASIENDNLGGYTLSFDVEFVTFSNVRWHLSTAYQPKQSVAFRYDYAPKDLAKHQHIPFDEPQDISLWQEKYAFFLGLAYSPGGNSQAADDS